MLKGQDFARKLNTVYTWLFLLLCLVPCLSACLPVEIVTENEIPTINNTPASDDRSPTSNVITTLTPQNLAVNTPKITSTTDCIPAGGSLHSEKIFSAHLDADFHFKIYLPSCYHSEPSINYPVIYLLHGLSNNNEQWLRLGLIDKMNTLIAEGQIAPFIVILPQEDRFEPPQTSLFADALIEELIPWVDAHYNTLPEVQYRGIGGISRGAAWAVRIGFENFDTFSRVGVHSLPVFEADTGKINTWITTIPSEDRPLFFIDIGRDDPDWQAAQSFANQLNQNNIPHEWYLFKNGHTESYWSSHLVHYLQWYAQDW